MIGGYSQDQKGGSGFGGRSSGDRNAGASCYFGFLGKQWHYKRKNRHLCSHLFSIMFLCTPGNINQAVVGILILFKSSYEHCLFSNFYIQRDKLKLLCNSFDFTVCSLSVIVPFYLLSFSFLDTLKANADHFE